MTQRKRSVFTKQGPTPVGPYSQAIRAGNFIFISGQVPVNPATGEFIKGSMTLQTQRCMDNIKAIVAAAGGGVKDIVKTTIFLTNMNDFAEVNEAYGNYFDLDPPARTTVQAAALPKGVAIEIDAVAHVTEKKE